MARIISTSAVKEVASYMHSCGALVEFIKTDIRYDRDGSFVICPSCESPPYIAVSRLSWTRSPKAIACTRCGSLDTLNTSQSIDCKSCGYSW